MLLLQTAFAQEFAAVKAASSTRPQSSEQPIDIAGQECVVLLAGIGPRTARRQLAAMLDRLERPDLVLSIGLAGGLHPQLKFGQSVLVGSVQRQDVERPIPSNLERLSSNLRQRMSVHNLLTLNSPALTSHSKEQLANKTTAAVCDMETFAVADECSQRQLPWIGARVISDTASDNIPAWIATLPKLVEQKRWPRLLGRVATHPQDLSSLLGLALRMQRLKPILTQLTIDLVTHVLPA